MDKSKIKKVVLAYSGGLDTSIIIPWLKENYNNPEIIAVSGNVGQSDELEGLEEKAIKINCSFKLLGDQLQNGVFQHHKPLCISIQVTDTELKISIAVVCLVNIQSRKRKHFTRELPMICFLVRIDPKCARGYIYL